MTQRVPIWVSKKIRNLKLFHAEGVNNERVFTLIIYTNIDIYSFFFSQKKGNSLYIQNGYIYTRIEEK